MKAIDIHHYLLDKSLQYNDNLLAILKKNGVIKLEKDNGSDIFLFLAKTIISQQLSYKSANAIWQKVVAISLNDDQDIQTIFSAENTNKLRATGISPNKLKAIFCVKDALLNQLIPDDITSQSHEQISRIICAVWGCGQWTADMFAIFYCRLPDILPASDLAIINGIRKIYGYDVALQNIAERFAPYRTYLSLHVWKAGSNKLI